MNGSVEDILATVNLCFPLTEAAVNVDFEKDDAKSSSSKRRHEIGVKCSQKRKRMTRSPSLSGSSVASTDDDSSKTSDSGSDSESNDSDKFDQLFRVRSSKKTPIKVKQIFQTQKRRLRRKLSTPGEEGRYMIKIELTDTKDLKKVKPNQYWTQVSAKAVFLAEPKSTIFKKIKSMLFDVGRNIKEMPGVDCEEMKLDKKSN